MANGPGHVRKKRQLSQPAMRPLRNIGYAARGLLCKVILTTSSRLYTSTLTVITVAAIGWRNGRRDRLA